MAFQINDPYSRGVGGEVGQNLGNILGSGMQQLAQTKLQQLQERLKSAQSQKQVNAWEHVVGNKALATIFAANPKLAVAYAQENGFQFPGMQQQQNQTQGQSQGLEGLMQNLQPQQTQQESMQPQSPGPMSQQDALQQAMQGHTLNPQQAAQELLQEQQPQQKKPLTKEAVNQQTEVMKSKQPWEILKTEPRTGAQQKRYEAAQRQQNTIEKTLKPDIEKIDKAHDAFKKDKYSYDALRETVKSGKLTPAATARLYTKLSHNAGKIGAGLGTALGSTVGGLAGSAFPGVGTVGGALYGGNIGAGLGGAIGSAIPEFQGTPLDQVFKKTVLGFMRNAKDVFGSRIPVSEMQMFLDTLPTLQMDDQAKIVIIDQMESMGKLADAQWKAKNEIIEQHGGNAPKNLMELIEKKTAQQADEVARKLRKTIDDLIAQTPTVEDRDVPTGFSSRQQANKFARGLTL